MAETDYFAILYWGTYGVLILAVLVLIIFGIRELFLIRREMKRNNTVVEDLAKNKGRERLRRR